MIIDLTRLIPPAVQQMAIDATIDFVVNKGKDLLSDEVNNKIASLRSDYGFQSAFKAGLQRAIDRFVTEYSNEDEDLVDALTADNQLFEDKAVQAAMLKILQRPGSSQNAAQETLSQSFDRVLPNRKNRERVNKAMAYFLKCLAEEVYHLPELRPLYELQFQRVTAESAREQVALQKAQLEATTAMSQEMRSALLQLTEAVVQQKLLPAPDLQGFGNLAGLENLAALKLPRHNLPQPDYQRFVGRKEQLRRIGELLSPKHRAWVMTIDGIGGIGKSALALEVADSYRRMYDKLAESDRFEAIIWTTAKLTVLTGQGIITRSQSLRTLDDIYSTIAVVLQREDITRARPADQDEIVRQALSHQRTLLIVDNLETVDDERVMAFLRDVPSPTKVIVTTRHRLDVAYPIRVVGMVAEESLHLIADQAELKGLTLLPEQAQKLFERTGGVPLAMVWSVAQMAFGYGVEAVLTRLGQPNNDVARFCFEAAIERIKDKPAYKLLLALSLFATDASREALGFVADLPELDRDDGLVELERLSLVNKEGARFGLLPLTKGYVTQGFNQNLIFKELFQTNYIHWHVNICQQFGGKKRDLYRNLDVDLQNIQLATQLAYELEKWNEFSSLVDSIVEFLDRRGLWQELVEYSEMVVYVSQITNNKELELKHKIYGLGWIKAHRLQKLDEGLVSIQQGKQLALDIGNEYEYGQALRREGEIYNNLKNYNEAQKSLLLSLEVWQKLGDNSMELRTLGTLGTNEREQGKIDKALEIYWQALKRAEEFGDIEQKALNLRRISDSLWLKGKFEDAREKVKQALEIDAALKIYPGVARCYLGLARIEYALGNIETTTVYLKQANELHTQLNVQNHLAEGVELLEFLTQSPNDPSAYLAKCGVHGY